ncbi:lysozyme inhibitor LprI family protein [Roseomonas sp. BN140053]|uniref:lysozyme inhibitor LprI family protein n=1 Tax=Roseomonas sp. BN140053 TaxID=3391898 RepID=UPI0039EBEC61
MHPLTPLAATVGLLLAALPARAQPSFNCGDVRTAVEKTICSVDRLGDLDRRLAELYARARVVSPQGMGGDLVSEQRAWAAARNRDCSPGTERARSACLLGFYTQRIEELEPLAAGGGGAGLPGGANTGSAKRP